jgi:hypothetical protein
MKTLTLLVLTVITLYLCGGCMAQPSVEETRANLYQQWNGRPFKQVISKIGLPKQQMPDGSGGTIYSYSETQTFQAPSQIYTSPSTTQQTGIIVPRNSPIIAPSQSTTTYGPTTVIPGRTYTKTTNIIFWVNSQGYIYNVDLNRN